MSDTEKSELTDTEHNVDAEVNPFGCGPTPIGLRNETDSSSAEVSNDHGRQK